MSGQDNGKSTKKPVKPGNKKRTPPKTQRTAPRTPPPERNAPKQPPAGRTPQKRAAQKRPVPANPDAANNTGRKPSEVKPARTPKPFKRKASPAKRQQIAAVLILLLTLYLIINLVVFGILLLDFNRQPGETQSYSLVLKKDKSKAATVDAAEANNEYGLYVPYSKLSLIADLSIMGDRDNATIIVRPGNDRIEINNNSSLIYINDNAIRLPKPVIFELNDYLLPIELVSNYMGGITITYDDKKSTCTLFRSTEDDAVVSAKITGPDGLDKCSIPPEPTPSESSDTSSANSGNSGTASGNSSVSTSSHTSSGNTSSNTSNSSNTSSANSTSSSTRSVTSSSTASSVDSSAASDTSH